MLSVNFKRLTDLLDQKYLVASSAGVDSMVLCHLLHLHGVPFDIAHCNYHLRTESDQEQLLVETTARSYNVKCHIKAFQTKEILKNDKRNIQELARDLRHNWFKELQDSQGYTHILTAHHKDDSRETFFINLLRGSSISGLTGIAYQNGQIIRPLISATKNDILDYALLNEIHYLEDSSNDSDDYLRNRIRHHVIPALWDVSPNGLNGFDLSMKTIQSNAGFLSSVAKKWVEQNAAVTNDKIVFSKASLEDFSPHLDVLLHLVLKPYHFNKTQINDITKVVLKDGGRFLSSTHELVIGRDNFSVYQATGDFTKMIIKEPGVYDLEDGSILSLLEIQDKSTEEIDALEEIVDLEKIQFPLTLRPWIDGERMHPLGMNGSQKKVKDILTDKKVNSVEKRRTLVLVDSNDQIIWLVGHRLSDDFKVTDDTKGYLAISWNKG